MGSISVNVGGTWKTLSTVKANVGGTWKQIKQVYVNVGGVWKPVWVYGTETTGDAPTITGPGMGSSEATTSTATYSTVAGTTATIVYTFATLGAIFSGVVTMYVAGKTTVSFTGGTISSVTYSNSGATLTKDSTTSATVAGVSKSGTLTIVLNVTGTSLVVNTSTTGIAGATGKVTYMKPS